MCVTRHIARRGRAVALAHMAIECMTKCVTPASSQQYHVNQRRSGLLHRPVRYLSLCLTEINAFINEPGFNVHHASVKYRSKSLENIGSNSF